MPRRPDVIDIHALARSKGAILLRWVPLPRAGDEHLAVVLCKVLSVPMEYVVWFYNVDQNAFGEGSYSTSLAEAEQAYEQRARRYGAKICFVVDIGG